MEELDAFIESNPDPRELKRAIAVRMTLRGHPHREIMNILQVCSGFISKWKQAFIINGIEGIKLGYQGSKAYLASEEKEQVIRWLKEKNSWHLNQLEYYIAKEFSITFSAKSSYYDLSAFGWEAEGRGLPGRRLFFLRRYLCTIRRTSPWV
jgi:putative transposase